MVPISKKANIPHHISQGVTFISAAAYVIDVFCIIFVGLLYFILFSELRIPINDLVSGSGTLHRVTPII